MGLWVEELRRTVEDTLAGPEALVLDLGGVSFIDTGGVALIRDLSARGVRLVNLSLFVAEQLRTPAPSA